MAFNTLATRKNIRLRLALSGVAGSGKTYTALRLAGILGGSIGVMDSERSASRKYVGKTGIPAFFLEELEEKNVQEYLTKVSEAAAAGVEVLVIDSYSHSWIGALETVDKMGGSKFSNGWKVVSPLVTKLVDAILSYPGHVIATMRSKTAYEVEKDERGKAVPKKIGMATVSRDGTDYEFDVMIDMDDSGHMKVSKTRCSELAGWISPREDIDKVASILKTWMSEGSPITPRDELADSIRRASTLEGLSALVSRIKELPDGERTSLVDVYTARKQVLQDEVTA